MRVLLVSLRDPFLDSDRVMPPLGVMSLHSYIKRLGVDVVITNDVDKVYLRSFTHIGISCMTPQRDQAYKLLLRAKSENPRAVVFIGGPHTTHYLSDCMPQPFDHIVVGDGEYAVEKILKGTVEWIVREEVDDLSVLPLPYRDKSFLSQYSYDIQGLKATTILTAKGCPNRCAFCEDAGTKVRLYPAEVVGRQIDQCVEAGFEAIMFFDDLFTLSMKRVEELTEEIRKRGVKFRCFGHARNMTEDMARLLAESGCVEVGFGAESGSQKILDAVNKKTTVEQNRRFVEICNKYGMKVKAFMIVGLPGEDHATVNETDDFLHYLMKPTFANHGGKIISNDFDVTVFYPYKGTDIRDNMDKYDITIQSNGELGVYKGVDGTADCVVRTSALSQSEIAIAQKKLLGRWKGMVIR